MVVEWTHNDAILKATLSFKMETFTCSIAQIADAEHTLSRPKRRDLHVCVLQLSWESRLKIN